VGRGVGGLAKELALKHGTYFGQKGLVPTLATCLLEQGKGLLVESRLAIDDDLRIGNYIALHCKKSIMLDLNSKNNCAK
jgi:hypothetical protein